MKKERFTSAPGTPYSAHLGIHFAMRVAARYQHRLPTVPELMHDFDMSRATACRWLSALRTARADVAKVAA